MQNSGYIFDIKKYSVNDGPGIRTTVFLKGCPLTCWWCHNPESRGTEPEKVDNCSFRWNLSHDPAQRNIIGSKVAVSEVMKEIEKDIPFYEESKGGVTFSGGEPMLQIDFLYELLSSCKKNDISTAIDTTGYASPADFEKIYDITDIFLYDLKLMDEKLHYEYCGVSNKLIHDNLRELSSRDTKIILRLPIIPTITDSEENISRTIEFISSLNNIREIDLLPFHSTAKSKYERMKIMNKVIELIPPDKKYINEIKNKFSELGIPIKIGG
ncbi:MAG: glycyl-radical enzyme activating protein [Ignavibacteriae bacterium HGW-Ignavibacteriae-3]|nr:MAG: glycyl-radical enzyme activating protein [Ignavibacteriae bacterium HGW-Ignavibacteriae-3]